MYLNVKARCGREWRKFAVVNEEQTYDDFVMMLQRVFPGALDPAQPINIKYQDEGVIFTNAPQQPREQ